MPKQPIAQTRYISLLKDERGQVSVKMDDGAIIVPINDEGLALVHTEPAPAYDGLRTICIPGGSVDAGENPSEAANREMQEEIGLKANQIDFLGKVDIFTKYVDCQVYLFLGRDLEKSELDGDEDDDWIEPRAPIHLDDIEALITTGELRDSATVNALLFARRFLENLAQNKA